jgi:hypothetical protein
MWSHRYRETRLLSDPDERIGAPSSRLPPPGFPSPPPHHTHSGLGLLLPSSTVHDLPARRTSIGERGELIIGDGHDHLARFQCPRCGAASRQPCEALGPGPRLARIPPRTRPRPTRAPGPRLHQIFPRQRIHPASTSPVARIPKSRLSCCQLTRAFQEKALAPSRTIRDAGGNRWCRTTRGSGRQHQSAALDHLARKVTHQHVVQRGKTVQLPTLGAAPASQAGHRPRWH